jgi:cell division protein FtsW (lipid II flippase)
MIAVACLYTIGLLCIYATEIRLPGPPTRSIKQSINLLVGITAFTIVLKIGHQHLARWSFLLVALAIMSLVPLVLARYIPLDPIIPLRRGAHRWIHLSFYDFQPSELMKIAYVVGLASYLRFRRNYRTFTGLLVPLIGSGLPLILILMEPDLGTALLIIPVLFIMLFAAGAKTKHILGLALVGLCMSPILWTQLQSYQRSRILGVLLQSDDLRERVIANPDKFAFLSTERQAREWEVDSGMQLVHSKAAIGSGGLTGHGWAEGVFMEYGFLPDKHNDFIFAIVGHQWGLFGCVLVLICYVIIVLAGVEIAATTAEPFSRLLAVGLVGMLAAQVTVNVTMTVGLMPITGMTLPFVSYGGSSLLMSFVGIALLISVSRYRPFLLADKPFEFDGRRRPDDPVRPMPVFRSSS